MTTAQIRHTDAASLGTLHYLGIALAAVTGVIHLALGVPNVPSTLGILFVLAGLGYLGGVVLLIRGVARGPLYLAGIAITVVQILAYVALNAGDLFSTVALVDKVAQLALVGVLVVLYRRET
ncbi:hypothetical protein AUR64_05815 [Haloprofundus marisrubri]|uniref:Uncharacterized protein n=1 Tax=Haloprofundus marisrubri TaxID=1514971 RepID=A0A0W1RBA1_9EURY|nr:hypothetical protein [Haloprofundus marisrubri]KTG10712.1 hypothetical protein AUR64_05815 [Haloprofundus marisrubri]